VVNGRPGTEPLEIEATVGQTMTLDASGSTDPDGNALRYSWTYYAEGGTGIPDLPVRERRRPAQGATPGQGVIPPSPAGGPLQPRPRVTIENAPTAKATVLLVAPGISHIILQVEDDGSATLTSYRRIILRAR